MSYKQLYLHLDISSTRDSDFYKKISITASKSISGHSLIVCELLAQPTPIKNHRIAQNDYHQGRILLYLFGLDT